MLDRPANQSDREDGSARDDRETMNSLQDFGSAARLLKILGHPIRLKIVCGLLGEPAGLSRIARSLNMPVSTLAQHLAIMRTGGILEERRHGVLVIFSVADKRIPAILEVLCSPGRGEARLPKWSWQELHR
jgi:DNA-binding transcriptional ArsR family regulator